MLDPLQHAGPSTSERLVSLLDYVEQVVKLDERVAFALADYKLPDGGPVSFVSVDTRNLPGVSHDIADDAGPIWLAVARLPRNAPPAPPDALAAWITPSSDPARLPAALAERKLVVEEEERRSRIAAGACADDFLPLEPTEPGSPPQYNLTLRLADQTGAAEAIEAWIATAWMPWAAQETPRRRTVAFYEALYKWQQQREVGAVDAAIELVWGVGIARWAHAGRTLHRPLLERLVDIELDEGDGTIRVRPTAADAVIDLKPFEEMGCPNLGPLEDLARREIDRAGLDEGISPFRRESFEPILVAAASRLDAQGRYDPDGAAAADPNLLTIDAHWVLFARPRSAHVLLADIERLRTTARALEVAPEGLASRLVTEPSTAMPKDWQPLAATLGDFAPEAPSDETVRRITDTFFPKPYNDDQIAIVERLAKSDGLVVQGPPGTGKTHTIANLICHAMATGQRVLVVSRGEAALSVLRDQLPEKVRPLAIALLSNERQGLRQVEGAVREIQAIVEQSRPEVRRRAIALAEDEIVKLRQRIAVIDHALDGLAASQAARMGPGQETPAEMALRLAAEAPAYAWFVDRPQRYAAETDITDAEMAALFEARRRVGDLIDHRTADLPSPDDLPLPEEIAALHDMILRAAALEGEAGDAFVRRLRLGTADVEAAEALADKLDGMARVTEKMPEDFWLRPFLLARQQQGLGLLFATLCDEWQAGEAERIAVTADAVELPADLAETPDARAAVARAARGERPWSVFSLGKGNAKALVAAVRFRGAPIGEDDTPAWQAVARRLDQFDARRALDARWRSFGAEVGADERFTLAMAAAAHQLFATARRAFDRLPGLAALAPAFDRLSSDPSAARALAAQLRHAVEAVRLTAARAAAVQTFARFENGADRTSATVRGFFENGLGSADADAARIAPTWTLLRQRLSELRARAPDFATINAMTARIATTGASHWAEQLAGVPAKAERDPLAVADWRRAWDWGTAQGELERAGTHAALARLAGQRTEAERNIARLFVDLVRERTFYALERRLSPAVKSALVQFVAALARLGKGTGRGAGRQRQVARDAMRRCYDAIPCWIMPTWRVADHLPSDLAAFDLVILDEASQSDVTELPALLRGRKILVVGDDRQVSPTAPFVTHARIEQLRHRYLRGLPFQALLEPGESLYGLMQAVFPEERLMLKEHFRCVEPIIRFSMQFYPETLLPLRIPTGAERLDPPLVDIFVPHGRRDGSRRLNRAEADVIVEDIATIAANPTMATRTIGVISLIGREQAELVRSLLSDRLGSETMQRHRILCGDSATFQGNERDIVFLSMVADPQKRQALTMRRYEQRFNVAASRARDRLVLVRSVTRDTLNPQDLKAKLIAHFESPMPAAAARRAGDDPLDRCESEFEREVMRWLLALGYRVEPQVGALGFRIDMVVEGPDGRRLAVECDGDRFHGPEVWRDDMRRQRILERVGWRFWRCFASTFHLDPEGTIADLVATLQRFGVEPWPEGEVGSGGAAFVEHRVAEAPAAPERLETSAQAELDLAAPPAAFRDGDRVVLGFSDGRKPMAVVVGAESMGIGDALAGREEDDEIEIPIDGQPVKAVIERIERAASR